MTSPEPTIRDLAKTEADKLTARYRDQVDPWHIAKRLGILVYEDTLSNGKLAMIVKRSNRGSAEIYLDEKQTDWTQRLALAHQIGHFIERVQVQTEVDEEFAFVDYPDEKVADIHEYFANEFAANLLMPEGRFVYKWYTGTQSVPELANFFSTPIQSVKYRVETLRSRNLIED